MNATCKIVKKNSNEKKHFTHHFFKLIHLQLFINVLIVFIVPFSDLIAKDKNENPLKNTIGFTENKGQFCDQAGKHNPNVLFIADLGGMKIQLRKSGFSYETYQIKPKWIDPANGLQTIIENGANNEIQTVYESTTEEASKHQYHYHRIDIELKNFNPNALITSHEKLEGSQRYMLPDKRNALADINNFTNVTFQNIYPDIDLVFKIDEKQQFKYDFIVHPKGKVEDIQLEYKGADNLVLNANGELEIISKFGVLIEKIPQSWYQHSNGTMEVVDVKYNLTGCLLTFESLEKQNQTLVIDPSASKLWATYYGDSLNDSGTCLAIDSFDNVYMGGYTSSTNNIATTGSNVDSLDLPVDGYLVKFTNDGQRLWGTYLAGFRPNDMDMNSQNQFVITSDSGIIQFNESGFPLWTYSRPNFGKALTYDPDGNVIAVGDSIIKLSSTGSLIWTTDYAGTSKLNDVDCDGSGNIYVVGHTTDTVDISTAGAHQINYGGGTNAWQGVGVGSYEYMVKSSHGDGMIIKLNTNGDKIWGTYYGGERFDEITSVAVSDDGDFAVSGLTNSLVNISSDGSFQPMLSRNNSIVFTQFCIGCSPDTTCGAMWVGDTCVDKLYAVPYLSYYQDRDAFIINFDQSGQRKWGTYFGVPASDYSSKIIMDNDKNIFNISLNKTYVGGPLVITWDSVMNTWGAGTSPNEPSLYPTNKYSTLSLPTGANYINLSKFDSLGKRKFTSYLNGTTMPGYPCDPEFSLFQGSLAIDNQQNIFINGKTIFISGIATEGAFKTTNENNWVGPNSFAVHDAFLAKFIQGNFDTIYEPQHTAPCTGDTTRITLGITPYPLSDFNFQWFKDNEILAGETDSVLIIPNSSVSNNGYYYCSFSDNGYEWKSDSANLFIQSEPAFTKVGNDTCHLCQWPSEIQNRNRVPFEEFWADIDNDSDLDAIIVGREKNIWINDNGSFLQQAQNLNQFSEFSAAIADYDGDNDMDLVINGDTAGWNTATTILYRNDNGFFIRTNDTFMGMFDGMIKWADIDNDGDQDLIMAGIKFNGGYNVYFYENREDSFLLKMALYPGNDYGFLDFADYDKDGDLDFLISGREGTKIYNNSSGNFTNINAGLQGLTYSSGKWGDYDSDGDLDIIFNGTMSINGDGDSTILYRNNAGTFERINHQIPNTRNKIHFVDYDNDGDLDVIGGNRLSQNNGNVFNERPSNTPELHTGILNPHVEPGDYDNDGDVDLLGWNEVYRNDACDIYNMPNLPPSAPVNLSSIIHYDTVQFSWEEASDNKTPQLSLTYNLRVGTTPGGNQTLSSLSDENGWRKIVGMGNVQQNTSWWLKLPEGTYYWSVQAIDNSFAGGSFSSEQTFNIIKHPQITKQPISSVMCPGDSIIISVETDHYFPVNYQWYRNNIPISGATDSIYAKSDADSSDIAQYFCKVSNDVYDIYTDTISIQVTYGTNFTFDTFIAQGDYHAADLDVDDDLDLIVNRKFVYNQVGGANYDPKTQIYFNSSGTYNLSGSFNFSADFGSSLITDLNSDGLPDILFFNSDSVRLFINNSVIYTQLQTNISNTNNAKVLSGDMDNDGDSDLVFVNRGSGNSGASVKILLNQDLTFLETTLFVPDPLYGDGLLIDFDQDGDLDIYYSGFHYYWNNPSFNVNYFARILRNDQSVFTEIDLGFGTENGSSSIGDFNNDGQTDIIISANGFSGFLINDPLIGTGFNLIWGGGIPAGTFFGNYIKSGDFNNDGFMDVLRRNEIYYSSNGNFLLASPAVEGLPGDYNNNGTLDLLAGGEIYRSQSCSEVMNTPPSSPSGLSVTIVDSIAHFSWDRANDAQTPQLGLSYNLRVGISPGGSEIMSAMSNQNGYRQIVDMGNVQQNTSWWLQGLAPGTYYWSVQAIDNSFAGGPFAPEQTFTVEDYTLKRFSAKVFLEGAFNPESMAMNNSLLASNLIPSTQPYSTAPWTYYGEEIVTSMPEGVIDWVLVELRQAASAELATEATIIEGWPKALLLKADGSIVDTDNKNPLIGEAEITENLYMVIRHRNHLDVMSAAPLILSGNTYSYDFTNEITKAYGGAAGYKQIGTGVYGMVAGDIDADGSVFASDFNLWAINFGLTTVYLPADVDMDGQVFASDFNKWAVNFGTNMAERNLKIFKSQVP